MQANSAKSTNRTELIKNLQIQDALKHRFKQNPLKYFIPIGKHEEVIRAIGNGKNFIVVFSAANAVGKTWLMTNILGNFVWGSQSDWFSEPLFKNFPYPKRARIASTPKNLEEIGSIQSGIKEWWPEGKYSSKKAGKIYDSEYKANDWDIDIMSYSQEVEEFESATLGLMIFDEPPPIKIFNATIARMRKGGLILIFMTPLDTGGEILDVLEEKEELEYEGNPAGNVKIVYAEVKDACKVHGKRGFLEHEHIIQMLSFYDEDEKEARGKGRPTHLIGRVYSDFQTQEPFVVDDFAIPKDWIRFQIIDPHDAIPFAVSWAAIDPNNNVWIYDEYPEQDLEKIRNTSLSYVDYARIFREREGRDKIYKRIIDPYFGNKRYLSDKPEIKTVKDEIESFGFMFENGSTEGIEVGHIRVREALKYAKEQAISALNHPRLHILKRCRNHWRSMYYYKRKLNKSGEVKDVVVLDQTFKHFCDNIRHLLMRDDLYYDELVDSGKGISLATGSYMTA